LTIEREEKKRKEKNIEKESIYASPATTRNCQDRRQLHAEPYIPYRAHHLPPLQPSALPSGRGEFKVCPGAPVSEGPHLCLHHSAHHTTHPTPPDVVKLMPHNTINTQLPIKVDFPKIVVKLNFTISVKKLTSNGLFAEK